MSKDKKVLLLQPKSMADLFRLCEYRFWPDRYDHLGSFGFGQGRGEGATAKHLQTITKQCHRSGDSCLAVCGIATANFGKD